MVLHYTILLLKHVNFTIIKDLLQFNISTSLRKTYVKIEVA